MPRITKTPTRTPVPLKRMYSQSELTDFESKIRPFYKDGKVDWYPLGVAYGAFVFKDKHYLATERYEQFINIMDQRDYFLRGEDFRPMSYKQEVNTFDDVQDPLF